MKRILKISSNPLNIGMGKFDGKHKLSVTAYLLIHIPLVPLIFEFHSTADYMLQNFVANR